MPIFSQRRKKKRMEIARRVDRRRGVDTSKLNNKNPFWWDDTLQGSKRVNIYECGVWDRMNKMNIYIMLPSQPKSSTVLSVLFLMKSQSQ